MFPLGDWPKRLDLFVGLRLDARHFVMRAREVRDHLVQLLLKEIQAKCPADGLSLAAKWVSSVCHERFHKEISN